jgi:ABC-2 type transport system permease protein
LTAPRGEVYDLGYQHYEGPREGRMRARKALWTNGLRTALGLGRGGRAKILPILLFLAVMAPAVIVVMVASTVGINADLPGHAGYYAIVSIVLILFSAIIAPELLCTDRRDRVLHLYLVRPLTSDDYVAGRWLAFFTIVLALVYSGQVVLFVGFTFVASEPLDYLRDNWLDVPRFLAAGLAVAAFTTTIPLTVASFTVRRAYAAGFVIGLFVVSGAVAGVLTECEDEEVQVRDPGRGNQVELVSTECEPLTGDNAKWFGLLNLAAAPIAVSDIIFYEEDARDISTGVGDIPRGVTVGWYLLFTVGPALLLLWRYRNVEI